MNYLPRRRLTATTQIPHISRKYYCVHNTIEREIDNHVQTEFNFDNNGKKTFDVDLSRIDKHFTVYT